MWERLNNRLPVLPFTLVLFLFVGGCRAEQPAADEPSTQPTVTETVTPTVVTPAKETQRSTKFALENTPQGVRISSDGRGSILRSTTPLVSANQQNAPVVKIPLNTLEVTDNQVAHNATYYYLQVEGDRVLNRQTITTPNPPLPVLQNPSILIDKIHYYLEVREGERAVKRYPVVLGGKPKNRKLHSDNASTPEGFYRIYNLQPNATYHKAFDIDYPTAIDRFRYDFARAHMNIGSPDIGGEIQIHGYGIPYNWTWGCIGLRNEDMDEMFSHPEIRAGTKVEIVGPTLTREDLTSIRLKRPPHAIKKIQNKLKQLGFDPGAADGSIGPSTQTALGLFQLQRGLPVTCQLDARTVESLDL